MVLTADDLTNKYALELFAIFVYRNRVRKEEMFAKVLQRNRFPLYEENNKNQCMLKCLFLFMTF